MGTRFRGAADDDSAVANLDLHFSAQTSLFDERLGDV
jgi:hypothetical protein